MYGEREFPTEFEKSNPIALCHTRFFLTHTTNGFLSNSIKRAFFSKIIYDSKIFDFRILKPANQVAWIKEKVKETYSEICCQIKDQNDRLILL